MSFDIVIHDAGNASQTELDVAINLWAIIDASGLRAPRVVAELVDALDCENEDHVSELCDSLSPDRRRLLCEKLSDA